MSSIKHITVGTDGSDNSVAALRWAVHEAEIHGASVDVVYSWNFPPVVDPLGVSMLPTIDDMTASATALLQAAKDTDLLVIGRRGHGGFMGLLLGSVAQHVAHHAPCPVVLVPA